MSVLRKLLLSAVASLALGGTASAQQITLAPSATGDVLSLSATQINSDTPAGVVLGQVTSNLLNGTVSLLPDSSPGLTISGSNLVTAALNTTAQIAHIRVGNATDGVDHVYSLQVAPDTSTKPLILICWGQSNCNGAGTANALPPAQLQQPIPNMYIYRPTNTSGANVYGFQQYWASVDSDGSQPAGNTYGSTIEQWGPEAGFGLHFNLDHPNRPIYFVKVATYGTELASPAGVCNGVSTWDPTVPGALYSAAQTTIARFLAALAAQGITPLNSDVAIIGMQGESDAQTLACGQSYYANLTNFISAVRSSSNGWGLGSNVPFVNGRISDSTSWAFRQYVREAQGRVATDVTNVKMYDTDGAELYSDNLHYDTSSTGMILVGTRAYQNWQGVYPNVAPVFPASLSATIQEEGATGQQVIQAASTNAANPSVMWDIPTGQSGCAGLSVDENGNVTVSDPSQMIYANGSQHVCDLRGSNGQSTVNSLPLTLNLTQANVTSVANTVFRSDLTNATYSSQYANSLLAASYVQTASGCVSSYSVNLTTGGGTGGQVQYVCTSGSLTAIQITNMGSGYTTAPPFAGPADSTFGTSTITATGPTWNTITDADGNGLALTAPANSRRPEPALFPGGTKTSLKMAANGTYAPVLYLAPTASILPASAPAVSIGLDFYVDPSVPASGTLNFLGIAGSATSNQLAVTCNLATQTISIGYVLAANGASSSATTNASCAPGTGHSLIVVDNAGAINVYEDGSTTPATLTLAAGGAARSTVTSSTVNGGINIGGSSTSSAFVGLFYLGSEILVSAENMTLAERNFEFARLNAAMK